ncbi:MAG: hypothetical protein H5U29_10945, partial [Pusillimonas sp.]|nr:hypothetical protein [Pusillimonas sp.]
FEAHASTSAQTRWTRWKELGWLLFNTLLPLAGGTLGRVAWLAQMEVALADFVNTDAELDPTGHEQAAVNLLVNIALLLVTHSITRLHEQSAKARTLGAPVTALGASEQQPVPPTVVQAASLLHLDFSWTRSTQSLTAGQNSALRALRADIIPASLGEPVPSGPLRGLYLQGDKFYAQLHGNLYHGRRLGTHLGAGFT